jgi:hypothetical protein
MDDLFDVSLRQIQLIAVGPDSLRRAEREMGKKWGSNGNFPAVIPRLLLLHLVHVDGYSREGQM